MVSCYVWMWADSASVEAEQDDPTIDMDSMSNPNCCDVTTNLRPATVERIKADAVREAFEYMVEDGDEPPRGEWNFKGLETYGPTQCHVWEYVVDDGHVAIRLVARRMPLVSM